MPPIVSRFRAGTDLPSPAHPAPTRFTPAQQVIRSARRAAFLLHRWFGIALALLMAVWAVSGIVMMYVSFPETTREERLAGLAPLDLSACCEQSLPLTDIDPVDAASVEMLVDRPVLRWSAPTGNGMLDLAAGGPPLIDEFFARSIAQSHMRQATGEELKPAVEPIQRDQWTVYGRFRQHEPLFKASFNDEAGTVLYVSGQTGEVVQDTTAHERFWNWLGAVPHWLYFTAFREIQPLWYNFVVYASVLGTFLTITGIYVGIRQYGRGNRRSPYRGVALWHHWTGLVFGIFTLTWVASGLVSMQPWGWFESEGPGEELAAIAGRPANPEDAAAMVRSLARNAAGDAVAATLSVQDDVPVALLFGADGSATRASLPGLTPAPLDEAGLSRRAQAAKPRTPIRSQELIEEPDAYHYSHHNSVILPAWRAIYADPEETRLYFDPRTGELLRKVDEAGRAYRWLHYGLHRWDFASALRTRPLWDAVVLPFMIGVSLLCVIGCWLAWRRATRRRRRSSLPVRRVTAAAWN